MYEKRPFVQKLPRLMYFVREVFGIKRVCKVLTSLCCVGFVQINAPYALK